jgi:tetratricopeptide (TPR) repeat protein
MRRADGTDAVKVIDFGIAKAVQGSRAGTATAMVTTEQGTLLGTIPYMAPEQLWRDPAAVDTRADVYALGAVLYEVLGGRAAYSLEGLGPAAAIETVTHTRPPRLGQVRRGLSGDLEVIVEKAMRAAPEERYDGVAGLRADLARFLARRPIAARSPSMLYTARKFAARHRVVVAAGAALVLIAGAAYVELVREERMRYREACDTAFAWLQETARMTRTIGQHGLRGPLLARLDRESIRFLEATPRNPAVVQLRAEVLDAVGDERLENGDLEGARSAFNEAVDLHSRLASESPHQSAALSRAIVRRGDAAKAAGEHDTMRVCYDQALAMDKRLAGARPDDPEALTNLIWSYDRVGVDLGLRGEAAKSLEHHQSQLRLAERLAGLVATADARRAVATAHAHLGSHAAGRGDVAGWREHAAASLRWALDAMATSPSDRLAIKEVLGARMNLSRAEEAVTGRPRGLTDAESVEREAAAARASDPGDGDLCFMHVLAMLNTAAVASAHGRDDLAELRLIMAEAESDNLLAGSPRDSSRRWLHSTAEQELDKTRERMSKALLEGSEPYP